MPITQLFKVITLNCHLFAGTTAADFRPSLVYKDAERLQAIVNLIYQAQPDLLSLCEVWPNSLRDEFVKKLQGVLPYHFTDSFTNDKGLPGSGLLLMSKWHINSGNYAAFTDLIGEDDWAHKGMLCVSLAVGYQTLNVVIAHTQADIDSRESESKDTRFKNLVQLYNAVQRAGNLSTCLLMGDFNVAGGSAEYHHMQAAFAGLTDQWPSKYTDAGITYDANNSLVKRWDPSAKDQRLDYVWMNQAAYPMLSLQSMSVLKDWQVDGVPVSDHYGLEAVYTATLN